MSKNKIKNHLLVTIIAAMIALFATNTAFSMGKVTLTVKNPNPYEGNYSWFVYEKEAGNVIEDVTSLKNFDDKPIDVKIFAIDATSSESGSFILTNLEDEQKGIGAWTEIETEDITIEPHEVIDIPFKIKIPEGIPPGQYLGGIVVETGNTQTDATTLDSSKEESNSASISIKTRVGSRVYLTVPGDLIEDIKLTDFSASKGISGIIKFNFTIENNGNTAFEPVAHIEIYTQTGQLYEKIDKSFGTSSPNTIIKPTVKMKKRPLMGLFTAKATIEFKHKFLPTDMRGAAIYEEKEVTFWAIPWEIILSSLFVVFVVLILITSQKLAKKRFFNNSEEYTVQDNENLLLIATKRNAKWKKIAKYNKLKPPYCVKPGDKIIVPKQTGQKEK